MIKSILNPKKKKDYIAIALIVSILFLIVGYIILEFISTKEDPPLGSTFHIFLGSTLMCLGGLGIFVAVKLNYEDRKKKLRSERKRRKHKIVFLKHKQHEQNNH